MNPRSLSIRRSVHAPDALRWSDDRFDLKARVLAIYALLAVLNIGSWIWALIAFHGRPALLTVALTVYGLGLRHAVDADHIAAIDNVTRKLLQEGKRPAAVGFFFALGHSLVIILVTAAVAGAVGTLGAFEGVRSVGGLISTLVSACFLFAVAAMNLTILASIFRDFRRLRSGDPLMDSEPGGPAVARGILSRILWPLFRIIDKSWHMLALGFLFGLGFDTATEVTAFGISAAQAAHGTSLAAIMAFPCLFAAGMALVDTSDGVLMLGAYHWAFVTPARKLRYNLAITLVSVVVAVLIGTMELLGLFRERFGSSGWFSSAIESLNDHLNEIGFAIVFAFLIIWALSCFLLRARATTQEVVR